VAFDSEIDRLDSGVCERGGNKREGFTFFNITRLTSVLFKHFEAHKRSGGRCGRAKDIYVINVGKDQTIRQSGKSACRISRMSRSARQYKKLPSGQPWMALVEEESLYCRSRDYWDHCSILYRMVPYWGNGGGGGVQWQSVI
jgi:hypothetical protein